MHTLLRKVVFFFSLFTVCLVHAAPSAKLWPKWQAHDASSQQSINHTAWNNILKQYLKTNDPSGTHLFRYAKVTSSDKEKLNNYIATLAELNISQYNRNEQMAYWINLYNALTIKVILEHMPVTSILKINISPGIFARGPWDAKLLTIEGESVSLNDIEHRILRPIWNDHRIHFAVNCASIGCPNLQGKAFTAKNINVLLSQAAKEFINHRKGVTFNANMLELSKIFDWYQADFGRNEMQMLATIQQYAKPPLQQKLKEYRGTINYQYDWALNN